LFRQLRTQTGAHKWLFPAKGLTNKTHVDLKSVTKQMTDRQEQFTERTSPLKNRRQDNTLVLADGINGKWTPHDMRRTGATMMQALKVPSDVIDRCQNHVLAGSKVRRAYQHHDFAEEAAAAWDALGEKLTEIFAEASKVPVEAHRAAT
jgi:integrase